MSNSSRRGPYGWAVAGIAVLGAVALQGGPAALAGPSVIRGPKVTRPFPGGKPPVVVKKMQQVGQEFLVTGRWYVTNSDDGVNFNGSQDKLVELKGSAQFDGRTVHSRTERDHSLALHAGNTFPDRPVVIDYYFDRPGSKMMRISGEYVDWDRGSGNDLMWRHDDQIDLDQILRDGRGKQGVARSGELVLPGDNNSESLDITITVTAGKKLFK